MSDAKCHGTAPVMMTNKVVAVTGCTGTGKTKLGIELAKKFNGEVISADSMQLYR